MVILFIAYELDTWLGDLNPILEDCLFGAVN